MTEASTQGTNSPEPSMTFPPNGVMDGEGYREKAMQTTDAVANMKFDAFHKENPDILPLFIRFAREAKAAGRNKIGAKMIAERIRWYTSVEKKGVYKMNNSHVSRYARMVVENCPDLVGIFEMRRLRPADGFLF